MATPAYMQDNAAELVRLIKDGAIFIRPAGNPESPTGTDWTPDVSYGKLGYYSDDGFSLTPNPGTETTHTGHNGDVLISEQDPGQWALAFAGLEGNEVGSAAYFDVDVAADGSVTVTSAATSKRWEIVTAGLDQRDRVILVHYPEVQIGSREALTFNRTTLLALGMTFNTFRGPAAAPYHFKAWGVAPSEDSGD